VSKVNVQFGESAPTAHWADKPGTLQGVMFGAMLKYMQDVTKKITAGAKDWKWGKVTTSKGAAHVYSEGESEDAYMVVSLIGNPMGTEIQVSFDCGSKEPGKRTARNAMTIAASDDLDSTVKAALRMMKDLKDSVVF